ncbi:hypothetical protein BDV59DRAFT_200835 [Aspergillus ambiguus]|uniref:uncharacterized protein n=1 Tax=Aspergillus ambiguus TaxID=176160 RepID=UPI003CCE06E5
MEMDPDNALQAYLIHQQLLAGIAPEDVIPMRGQRRGQPAVPRTNQPTLLRINNEGIFLPNIPPARFTGVIHPLPVNLVRSTAPATLPAPVDPPQAARKLPQVPCDTRVEPARPLNALPGVQTAWDIPRLADFLNPPSQKASVILPGVDALLQGVPAPQSIPEPPESPIQGHETELHQAIQSVNEVHPPLPDKMDIDQMGDFNFLQAFTVNAEYTMAMTDYLGVKDIVNLMATSRHFNDFMKTHESAVATRKAYNEALEAARAHPPVCYPSLCVKDSDAAPTANPSLRWLAMVTYREKAAEEIVNTMGELGYPMPRGCAGMLKKLWFLFDVPDNERREWTAQNVNLWPNVDVFYCTFFLVTVDEYFSTQYDNHTGELRRLSMAQSSLSFFLDVLKNRRFDSQLDVLQTFVRWQYQPKPHEAGGILYGVSPEEVGLLQYENYGRRGERTVKFVRPDVCVLKELTRRHLNLDEMYRDMDAGDDMARYCNVTVQDPTWDYEVRRHAVHEDAPDWVKALHMSLEV